MSSKDGVAPKVTFFDDYDPLYGGIQHVFVGDSETSVGSVKKVRSKWFYILGREDSGRGFKTRKLAANALILAHQGLGREEGR